MIITLKNTTKRMRVYQLGQRYAAGEYKSRSESVTRLRQRADGGADVRTQRLRHGPVLRLLAGETKDVPAALLHDPQLRRDTKGRRPPLKILKRTASEDRRTRSPKAVEVKSAPQPKPEVFKDAGVELADDQSAGETAGEAQPIKRGRGRSKDS